MNDDIGNPSAGGPGEEQQDGSVTWLCHNRIDLALHLLRAATVADHRPLLVLHGLGEQSVGVDLTGLVWPGPVYGLDFTGHGRSTVPSGGGYTAEILVGDVDAALERLGPVTILGRGLGAYIALLSSAARSDRVIGAILTDGPGIEGGGIHPGSPSVAFPPPWSSGTPDPVALLELSHDVRPPDYAQDLLRVVSDNSSLDRVLYVSAVARPEWLEAVANQPGVHIGTVEEALGYFTAQ